MRHNRLREFDKRAEQMSQVASQALRVPLESASQVVSQLVSKYPVACLAATLSIGVVVGWLAKRR